MSLIRNMIVAALLCLPASFPASAWAGAQSVSLSGDAVQGGLLRGTVPVGTKLRLGAKVVPVGADGQFIIGFGRDEQATVFLTALFPNGKSEKHPITVRTRQYDVQHIDGLPSKMVTPPPEVTARIKREGAKVAALRTKETDLTGYQQSFIWPAVGRVSGVYGSQRVLNGEPRRPHFGLDIAAPTGTAVVAPAAGKVILVADLYYTGLTVLIDHGQGLNSVYCHLDRIDVEEGAMIAQGQPLGTVGATGRATGPHLHWGLNWFDVRLDPQLQLPQAQAQN